MIRKLLHKLFPRPTETKSVPTHGVDTYAQKVVGISCADSECPWHPEPNWERINKDPDWYPRCKTEWKNFVNKPYL